jgi:putative ABC transport system permease protein
MKKTSSVSLIALYSFRLFVREWKKFVLPLVSLSFTAGIVLSVLLLTDSASSYLTAKNKELVGADVALEANYSLSKETLEEIVPSAYRVSTSEEFSFSTIIGTKNNNIPVSMIVVDEQYPVYGTIDLAEGQFATPEKDAIYIDRNTAEKLSVTSGDSIIFSEKEYRVKGIVDRDPRQLLAGFSFLPKVIMSQSGFEQSGLQKSLLRAEYETRVLLAPSVTPTQKQGIVLRSTKNGISVDVVGVTRTGFIEGLSIVEQFLILTVLLVCILSAVNMYAGVLYLISILKKSFSVLLALGLSKPKLALTISTTFLYTLLLALFFGSIIAFGVTEVVFSEVLSRFDLALPRTSILGPLGFTAMVLFSVSIAAFVPSIRTLLDVTPKELLQGQEKTSKKPVIATLLVVTLATLAPLAVIAVVLLNDIKIGFLSILVLAGVYSLLAIIFYFSISVLYRVRFKVDFMTRSIISFKKADGMFGIVSLTSLYIALTALSVLILLQSSLNDFLKRDLGTRIPSLYIIDVQKSQVNDILSKYPDTTLFPNVGARILSIDGLDIQAGLAQGKDGIDRELGREYNLTYRAETLSSEELTSGAWLSGLKNEVSVDSDFAKRANISLGSTVVFSIQGFPVQSTVTSLRKTDSRSGLPFFYFVFNPQDLEQYPATFFGYGYFDELEKKGIISYLAGTFANISVIDTKEVAAFAEGIIGGLLVLVFIISVPPLILSLFLIVTLVIASYSSRRKVSAQLAALGAKPTFITGMYYLETLSAALFSSVIAYITAVIVTYIVSIYYLKLPSWSYYTSGLVLAFVAIIALVSVVAYSIRKSDKRSIREILSYEE